MKSFNLWTGASLLTVLTIVGCRGGRAPLAEPLSDWQGHYRIISGERSGSPIGEERLQDVTVRILDDVITTYDADRRQVYGATLQLTGSSAPWQVTLTSTVAPAGEIGTVSRGLVQRQGNQLHLVYALPGGEPPTEFRTETNQQLFVLEAIAPD
jgi:uncharacterized protein (TIGR03067 family)